MTQDHEKDRSDSTAGPIKWIARVEAKVGGKAWGDDIVVQAATHETAKVAALRDIHKGTHGKVRFLVDRGFSETDAISAAVSVIDAWHHPEERRRVADRRAASMAPADQACRNCRWWGQTGETSDDYRSCVVDPPRVAIGSVVAVPVPGADERFDIHISHISTWPETMARHRCGRWTDRRVNHRRARL